MTIWNKIKKLTLYGYKMASTKSFEFCKKKDMIIVNIMIYVTWVQFKKKKDTQATNFTWKITVKIYIFYSVYNKKRFEICQWHMLLNEFPFDIFTVRVNISKNQNSFRWEGFHRRKIASHIPWDYCGIIIIILWGPIFLHCRIIAYYIT